MKLQNQEIWLAYPKLVELSKCPLPVEASAGIARLIQALQQPYIQIEQKRSELVRRFGKVNKDGATVSVGVKGRHAGDYAIAFAELLTAEWAEDIPVQRVILPGRVMEKCQTCGHETNIKFLIAPQMLLPLVQHFVGVLPTVTIVRRDLVGMAK